VDTLRLTNLWTRGGICKLEKMNIGILEVVKNEVGFDEDLSTKELWISTTVTAANMTIEDNVEMTMTEPAIQ
jgi:hypothetical protein